MSSQWFVLQTLSGQEQKVEKSINQRLAADEMGEFIDEVLVPMEKVVEVKGGKKSATNRKLFPGYVFIRMKLFDEEKRIIEKPWYFIRNTQGITKFVGGDHPVPTPDAEVDAIKVRIDESEDAERPRVEFEVNEQVKINDGPFLNYTGVIEEIDADKGKLKVTISIFGRNTPVELEYWQVEKT
tara:strand:- start:1005 stop:1553 length:549 start_codon:yes stop_codon:yes gene_type:complete